MDRRIVVTGIGIVSSIGMGREAFWGGLLDGRTGVSPVESFDTSRYSVHNGGEVKNFDPQPFCTKLEAEGIGRASQMAVAAAKLALEDGGLRLTELEPAFCGVAMGTTSGEPREVERYSDLAVQEELQQLGPELIGRYPCHLIAANIARELELGGPNIMIPAACAAGNYAIAYAFDTLRWGRAHLMLAGGSDAFSRITFTGFSRLGAIAPEICQPFDRERKGMIPGEGAAVLILEPHDRATRRGARIYAEVAGYGLSCDAHHMTASHPSGDGPARAMEQALRHSGLAPEAVSYISAHGTGTPTNDRLETAAVKRALGSAAQRVPMSSIKSMLGHTMGAASAMEGAVCSLAVCEDRIPPTINYSERDPECDLDCVPNIARDHRVEVAMNNAYAFGGNNASVIFQKFQP